MFTHTSAKLLGSAGIILMLIACAAPAAQAPAAAVAEPVVKTKVVATAVPAVVAVVPAAVVPTVAAVVAPAAELWAAAGPPAIAADFSPTSPGSVQLAAGVPQLVEVYAYY